VEAEEAVQIDRTVVAAGLRDADRRSQPVVLGFAERHEHVQAVERATLKDGDEQALARVRCGGRAGEESRREPEGQHRGSAGFDEDAS